MADPDSSHTAKNPDTNPKEVQWQIPFDAATNDYWEESTTPKESGTAEINSPAAWGNLRSIPGILHVAGSGRGTNPNQPIF
jgi:hypothetical protein